MTSPVTEIGSNLNFGDATVKEEQAFSSGRQMPRLGMQLTSRQATAVCFVCTSKTVTHMGEYRLLRVFQAAGW